jgi:hypothetical protein
MQPFLYQVAHEVTCCRYSRFMYCWGHSDYMNYCLQYRQILVCNVQQDLDKLLVNKWSYCHHSCPSSFQVTSTSRSWRHWSGQVVSSCKTNAQADLTVAHTWSSRDNRRVATSQGPPCRAAFSRKRNYCEEEVHTRPEESQQPYGTKEGVAIETSRLPGAGKGLFGVRASNDNPLPRILTQVLWVRIQ